MSKAKQFPASEGWIKIVVTLKSREPVAEEAFKREMLGDNDEVGSYKQKGKKITVFYRTPK